MTTKEVFRMSLKIIFFIFFIVFSFHPLLLQAQDSKLDPSRVKWTTLYYKTYVLLFSVKIRVNLIHIHLATSKDALLTPKEGQETLPEMDPSCRIDIDSKIMGRNSLISLWFDPDGTAFQRTQTDTGTKKRVKTYRILKNGFYSQEIKPGENEGDLPPNKWTQLNESTRTFNKIPAAGTVVTEPTALYYLVSASSLNRPGDKLKEYIWTKYGIYELELYAVDYKEIETDYEISESNNKRSLRGKCKTLHIKLTAAPIDPSEKNEFKFLGLKRDIDLYMDPVTRVLLQISGKADKIGHTDIKLKEVTF